MVRRFALFGSLILLAGCGGSGGAGPVTVATADLSADRLQFSVGTANLPAPPADSEGVAPANGPILNVVETFRQPNGASALLTDNVTITGPSKFVVTQTVDGLAHDGGASNQLIDSLLGVSAFGESLGVNTNGIATAASLAIGATVEPGGPPAFPRTSDGNYPAGFTYAANVVTVGGNKSTFPSGFPLGAYTLRVSTPPNSSEAQSWTAVAKLSTMTTLGTIPAPQVAFDGQGGGSVSLVVPPGVSELFVGIVAGLNLCWPFSAATNTQTSSGSFALFVKSPKVGPLTLAIPDKLGPPIKSGNAPTFCSFAQNVAADTSGGSVTTGSTVTVQAIGVDYPLYEMSYPQSTAQLPPIVGPHAQSDVTVSAPTAGAAP